MTRPVSILTALAAAYLAPLAAGQAPPPEPAAEARPAAITRAERPLTELPYTPSLDVSAMDRSIDPCADLYHFACGGWQKRNPIPPDQARWNVYGKLGDQVQQLLWGLLEEAAVPTPDRTPARQKVGDYFAACMDEAAAERAGRAPLVPELEAIDALASKDELAPFLGRTHASIAGSAMAFGVGVDQDPGNSEQIIPFVFAGGLGLPDRDYYVKEDAKSIEIRARYLAHVAAMLELLGDDPERAAAGAATVMRIETALARASLTRVERRDPHRVYHRMPLAQIQELTPSFAWQAYFNAIGLSEPGPINVTEPRFLSELEARLTAEPLADWKTYLRWHLALARADSLSAPFVRANFDFYRAYLRGVETMPPRWKRCVQAIDRDLGEALGRVFVDRAFPPEVKARTQALVAAIQEAMKGRLEELPWMSPPTRKRALEKLALMRNKIGYPDSFRDYGALDVARDDLLGNVVRAAVFETHRQLAKVGKPVDRGEWAMTAPTVNAYYNASLNDMNFAAGILLPPLFDPRSDDAPNFGNTGSTVGHELIHGFDDEGRQFDAHGNLRDWWTKKDAKAFTRRAACVTRQYASYVIVDDIRINSELTLGEDLADLGGTVLAWQAWRTATAGQELAPADGLTPEQRFFVGLAQWACENQRDENLRVSAITDPHSPGIYRINGVVTNLPEFAAAFACKPGSALRNDRPCRVW